MMGAFSTAFTMLTALFLFTPPSISPAPTVKPSPVADLLQKARKVADVSDWEVRAGYRWLNDQDVLFVRSIAQVKRLRPRPQQTGSEWTDELLARYGARFSHLTDYAFSWAFYHRNIRTRVEAPLVGFNRVYTKIGLEEPPIGRFGYDPDALDVSSDGRWILFHFLHYPYHAITVDGKQSVSWTAESLDFNHMLQWLPGTHQWMQADYDAVAPPPKNYFLTGNVDKPGVIVTMPVVSTLPTETSRSLGYKFVLHDNVPMFYLATWSLNSFGDAVIYELKTVGERRPGRAVAVHWSEDPGNVRVYSLEFSPQGDRIAWVLGSVSANGQARLEVWVSHMDGSDKKIIGRFLERRGKSLLSDGIPEQFRWPPDGKRLSFLYQQALWIVPVD